MKIKIELELPDKKTAFDVQNLLLNVFELAQSAAETNAAKTTVKTDNGHAVTVTLDEVARLRLRMTKERATQIFLDGFPCLDCLNKSCCNHVAQCESVRDFLAAELEVLASKSLCNKSCALFGQCPFVEDVTKCEKYNAPRFED